MTMLYQRGQVTERQEQALQGWLEDGRGVRRHKQRRMVERQRTERQREPDIMAESAARRYKQAHKRLEAVGVLDDLELAIAGDECDIDKARQGMELLVVFYHGATDG